MEKQNKERDPKIWKKWYSHMEIKWYYFKDKESSQSGSMVFLEPTNPELQAEKILDSKIPCWWVKKNIFKRQVNHLIEIQKSKCYLEILSKCVIQKEEGKPIVYGSKFLSIEEIKKTMGFTPSMDPSLSDPKEWIYWQLIVSEKEIKLFFTTETICKKRFDKSVGLESIVKVIGNETLFFHLFCYFTATHYLQVNLGKKIDPKEIDKDELINVYKEMKKKNGNLLFSSNPEMEF